MNIAELAFYTFLGVYPELDHIPSGYEAEEGPQGTEITTPESLFGEVNQDKADEDESDEKALHKSGIERQVFGKLSQAIP